MVECEAACFQYAQNLQRAIAGLGLKGGAAGDLPQLLQRLEECQAAAEFG